MSSTQIATENADAIAAAEYFDLTEWKKSCQVYFFFL